MSDTTFSAGTVIASTWLQDVNDMRYKSGTGKGADAVTVLNTLTGSTGRSVQSKLNDIVSVKDFGAVGDGVTNDYTALNNAFQSTGKLVYIPKGTYLYNTALTAPQCAAIIGEGELVSILKPGSGLTRGLSIGGTNYPTILEGFCINGALATTATGLFLGESAAWTGTVRNVRVTGFSGAGGIGCRLGDVLKSVLVNVSFDGNKINELVSRVSAGYPTTVTHIGGQFPNAGDIAISVLNSGGGLRWIGGSIDSATNEGIKVVPGASVDAADIVFDQMWLEACNSAGNFMATVDASAASATAEVSFLNCNIRTSGGTAKAIDFTGSGVRGVVVRPTFSSAVSGGIRVRNSALVSFDAWNPRYSATTVIDNTSGSALGLVGPEVSWTPTYTPNGGGTFTAITTNLAKYRYIGSNLLKIDLTFTGTIAGTVSSIDVQLYSAGATGPGSNWGSIAVINTGGTAQAGTVSNPTSTANLRFQKLDGSNLAAGTFSAYGTFIMELTA